MTDEAESSVRQWHKDVDGIPTNMQFWKWSEMDKLSENSIDEIRKMVWCKDKQLSRFFYMLARYNDMMTEQDKEHKEKLKKAKEEEAKKSEDAEETTKESAPTVLQELAPTEGPSAATPEEQEEKEDAEVQVLLEQRREILRELEESAVEDSEMEAADEAAEDALENEEVVDEFESPASPPEAAPSIVIAPKTIPITQAAVVQPATLPSVKQETHEDPSTALVSSMPAATEALAVIPTTAAAPVTSPAEPPQMRVKPEPLLVPSSYSVELQDPIGSPQSTCAVADEPLIASTVDRTVEFAARAVVKTKQRHRAVAAVARAQQLAASEGEQQAASAAATSSDPFETSVISANLVHLNKQIEYLDQIKDLAQAMDLPSEYFYTVGRMVVDSSLDYDQFKEAINIVWRTADRMDSELCQFNQQAVCHLRNLAQSVRKDSGIIWKRFKTTMQQIRSTSNAKERAAQRTRQDWQPLPQKRYDESNMVLAESEGPSTSRSLQRNQQQNPNSKRRNSDGTSPAPVSRKMRRTLLQRPPTTTADNESTSEATRERIAPAVSSWGGGCGFCCQAAHDPVKCPVYKTWEERKERRIELDLCKFCLVRFFPGHLRRCPNKDKACSHCHGMHGHTALCMWLACPPRREKPQRNSFFTNEDVRIRRRAPTEDDEAEFSPIGTPAYEEEVKTSEPDPIMEMLKARKERADQLNEERRRETEAKGTGEEISQGTD